MTRRSSRSAWMSALGLAALAAAGLSAWAQANSPPNPVFKTSPPPDTNGRIAGPIPLEVTFNMCQSTDPDPGDELRFTYDFDGDGTVDFRGPCRASEVYRTDRCTRVTVCVSDRQVTLDGHTICRQYEVCPFGRDEGPGAAPGVPVLFAANGAGGNPSTLFTLNPANGAIASTIGPIGFGVTGMAMHPTTKVLYGTTGASTDFITINTTTGAGTLIGDLTCSSMADIDFNASGTLFGWGECTDELYTINLTTGAATLVGPSGIGSFGSGLAFAGGTLFLAPNGNTGSFYSVNPGTGAATFLGVLTGAPGDPNESVSAMSADPSGVLFASLLDTCTGCGGVEPRGRSYLVTINTGTRVVTNRGQTVDGLDAIAWSVP